MESGGRGILIIGNFNGQISGKPASHKVEVDERGLKLKGNLGETSDL